LQDFVTNIAYGIDRAFGDSIICISIVVIYLKDFSSGLRENGQPEFGK